jgi:putative transposase
MAENRLLPHQFQGRVRFSYGQRKTLPKLDKRLGKKAIEEAASFVKADTILASHRKIMTQKFDGPKQRKARSRPKVEKELEALVIRLAPQHCSWGCLAWPAPCSVEGLSLVITP